jgi:tetratricopeptide (TPR) repeat protein
MPKSGDHWPGWPVAAILLTATCFLHTGQSALLRAQMTHTSASLPPPMPNTGMIVVPTAKAAQDILAQLHSGVDFAVLAKEKSTDATAKDGGYVGSETQLTPPLRAAASALTAGEFSPAVQIPAGYAVLTAFVRKPKTEDLDGEQIKALVVRGAVRDTIDVSGMAQADAAFNIYPKPEGWQKNLSEGCSIRKDSYASAVSRIEQILPKADADSASQAEPGKLVQGHATLAQLYSYMGDMEKATAEWQKAYAIAEAHLPEALPYLEEALGVSYLHWAEMENGVYRSPGELGLFPPAPGTHLEKQANARLAIQHLTKYLQQQPANLEARWLLNVAYTTAGGYPSEVPAEYLIPKEALTGTQTAGNPIGVFRDVAVAAGLNAFSGAGGVVVDDFDNDGLLDVVTSSMDMCEPLRFFHNNGDGTFTDRAVQAGLANELGGLNVIKADYNNDGCMDLLVLRGGWEVAVKKSLLRNNCDGTFTDVTEASGLANPLTATQTAVFADIDNDGNLDLIVGNENSPSQLFRNRGDGTFEDISHAAGIDKVAFTKGVTAADYDNDGYIDIYFSNVTGANFLYHNNHDGTFTDVGRQAGVQAPYYSFATWFFDYDNDGWPDLFVNCYFSSMDDVVRSNLGQRHLTETVKLYRNLHNGTFEDVTARTGLDKVWMPMGANFGDIDNDGFLDMYLGMGQPSLASMMPHLLLRNEDGKRFSNVTAEAGLGELHKGHGIVFADLARSGHEDILAGLGGAVPSDKHAMRVFENPGNGNDWINVRLTGVKSNRAGIGARIEVTVQNDGNAARAIYRTVGETSSFGGNPVEQHIGLGHGARIMAVDIWWPATSTRQHFTAVEKNEYIGIEEFAHQVTKLDRRAYRLGAAEATR